jgi:hypothetical protein
LIILRGIYLSAYSQIQANKEAAMDKIQADLDNFVTQTYMHMSANAQRVSDSIGCLLIQSGILVSNAFLVQFSDTGLGNSFHEDNLVR